MRHAVMTHMAFLQNKKKAPHRLDFMTRDGIAEEEEDDEEKEERHEGESKGG